MTIFLSDNVAVSGGAGPIAEDTDLWGSFRCVADTTERDAIPLNRRKVGMQVYSIFDDIVFKYVSAPNTWLALAYGGGGSGATITAATAAALTGIDDTLFNDGTIAFVVTYADYFSLDINDTTTPASDEVVVSFAGKRWLRLNIPSIRWSLVPAWEIDFAAGNDQNSGAPGFPLKTRAELSRRLGRNPTQQNTTVTYLSDHTAPIQLNALVGSTFRFWEIGQATTVLSGAITNFANAVPGMNLHDAFNDTGVASWAPYLGKRIKLTSGANSGAFAWIGYDTQAGNVVTSPWRKYTANGGLDGTDRPPTVADTYVVEDLTRVNYASIATQADAADPTGNPTVQTFDLDWGAAGLLAADVAPRGGFRPVGCKISHIPFISTAMQTTLCGVVNGVYMNPCSVFEIYGGLNSGLYGLNITPNCTAYLYGIPLFNASASIYVQSGSTLEVNGLAVLRSTAGFVGASGSHITADQNATVRFPQKFAGAADTFYGSVATRRAITSRGATITFKTGAAQTAVGTLAGGDVEFGTNDQGAVASDATGLYTPGTTMTWAAVSMAGNLHSIETNSHIYQVP